MPDGIVMMYWDCPICGQKKIPGDHRVCPSCGKDRTVQCYIVEGEGEITDAKGIADALSGPDWQCGKCGHFNKATVTACGSCGATKAEGTTNKVIHYHPGEHPTASKEKQKQEASPDRMAWRADPAQNYVSDTPVAKKQSHESSIGDYSSGFTAIDAIKPLAIFFGAAILVFALWFLFIRKVEVTVNVSGFTWTRTVNIEKYAWVAETSLSGFPAGSRNQRQNWEIVGNHQEVSGSHIEYTTSCSSVPDGESCSYTDLGNGRASRSCTTKYRQDCKQVPHTVTDYRTVDDWGYRYYYEIQRWIPSRSPQASGSDRKPFWPGIMLATTGDVERETGRTEVYVIHYVDKDNKEYTREVPFDEWNTYDQNGIYKLTLNSVGTILDIEKVGENSQQ